MNDFRTTYRDAVSEIENVHIDVTSVLDEGRRKRFMAHRKRQKFVTVVVAGGIFVLCTLGTVQAAEYVKTVIKANEYGFQSADAFTMAFSEKEGKDDTDPADRMTNEEWEEELQNALKMGNDELMIESSESVTREYTSIKDFKEQEDTVFALPDMEQMGYTVDSEQIWVNGAFTSVRITCGEKHIFFDRIDHSDARGGHASSTVYTGGVCNERTFTTQKGYEYILVDSKEKTEEGQFMIHAAISVGYYEMYVDFFGFGENEVRRILEETDLSLYEPGEF